MVRCLLVTTKRLKKQICVELESEHPGQRADAGIPASLVVPPTSGTVHGHRHVGVCAKGACSALRAFLLLPLVPRSSHPDSLMQMEVHTLSPFLISASDIEGEVRAPIVNCRNSINIPLPC